MTTSGDRHSLFRGCRGTLSVCFVLVHGAVCNLQGIVQWRIAVKCSHPNGNRETNSVLFRIPQLTAKCLDSLPCGVFAQSGDQDQKLISTDPEQTILWTKSAAQRVCNPAQAFVTRGVTPPSLIILK